MFTIFTRSRAKSDEREKRVEELRAILLASQQGKRGSEEAKKAIAYCEYCIRTYESWFDWNESKWFLWQRVVIVGGVVATLAGVMSVPPEWIWWISDPEPLGWLRGVPAAVVTIAAGFLGSFTYREDAVRHELTANALWNGISEVSGRCLALQQQQ